MIEQLGFDALSRFFTRLKNQTSVLIDNQYQ